MIFIKENAYENDVCNIAAILSQPQYVNPVCVSHSGHIKMAIAPTCYHKRVKSLLNAFQAGKQQPPQVDINTLRPRHNGRHFADDIFKRIFLNEDILIPIKISLKFVPKGSINNIAALVQIMAWRRPGDKPLSEPMMVSLLTHICVSRPQWVNPLMPGSRLKINCNLKFNICFYH